MDRVKQLLAVFLLVTGLAVALNLILTPVYHDGAAEYPVWRVMNWFMAVGVLAALAVGYLRKRDLGSDGTSTIEYLRVNAAYYGAIVLTTLFFWEWFWTLNPGSETGDAVTSHLIYFPIVDSLYVVLALATGRHLWINRGDSTA